MAEVFPSGSGFFRGRPLGLPVARDALDEGRDGFDFLGSGSETTGAGARGAAVDSSPGFRGDGAETTAGRRIGY